jgi:hypothetical protein
MFTGAKDVPRHVIVELKNVVGWLGNREPLQFFGFIGIIISLLALLPPPLFRQKRWAF